MKETIKYLVEALYSKIPAALCTVVTSLGSSSAKVGAQLVLLSDGNHKGTIGGGRLEEAIIKDAKIDLNEKRSNLHHYKLTQNGKDAIGAACGGEVTVFIQTYYPPPQLIIIGAGNVGKALGILGQDAGFEVVIIDKNQTTTPTTELNIENLQDNSYIVIMTTDHISDEKILRIALNSQVPYIGMIGSKLKWKLIKENLINDGYKEDDLKKIYAPIGLDIGGNKPQEIAVAILAEIISTRYNKNSNIKSKRV
jgi:xanthine dehydrogenase accessory factor